MLRLSPIALLAATCLLSCSPGKVAPGTAVFSDFSYRGEAVIPSEGHYSNPILRGFYPDPSVCRTGDDYWMVNSSFGYFPGLPVWHSTDLVRWEQCGSALTRNAEFFTGSNNMVVGTFAPQISYNPGNGLYYIICTFVGGYGCFYVTSADPASGRWSAPATLPGIPGIDPSLLFDDDGRAYLVGTASIEDLGETPLYRNDAAIFMMEFDWEQGTVTGDRHILVRHGVHPEQEPASIEGPHLYHIGDKYFLMCAEGGTEAGHSEVVFSSDSPCGPFEACKINPILTQRDVEDSPVSCAGHADLVQGPDGQWYAVFLGVEHIDRPNNSIVGRQTFLLPFEWVDGQPLILAQGEKVPLSAAMSADIKARSNASAPARGAFEALWDARDGLCDKTLFIRNPLLGDTREGLTEADKGFDFNKGRLKGPFWNIDLRGRLCLRGKGAGLGDYGNPAAIARRISDKLFSVSVLMDFTPQGGAAEAGIFCFQNDEHYMLMVKTLDDGGRAVMRLSEVDGGRTTASYETPLEGREASSPLFLRVQATEPLRYEFAISRDGRRWKTVGEPLDGGAILVPESWGFMGGTVGIYNRQ